MSRRVRRSRSRRLAAVLFACLGLLALPSASWAQPTTPQRRTSRLRQQKITQAQAELYERWRANINLNQTAAFEAGREYVGKYPNDEYAARVGGWVRDYERAARKLQFEGLLFREKKYGAAYAVGKQVLADEPDNLRTIISLASAGYLAANTGDTSSNAETLAFARRATELLERGDKPSDWKPFNGQSDALAYLNFITGELVLKETPVESIPYFRKAIEAEGSVRNTPIVYARLAAAYVAGEYEPLARRFAGSGGARPPESEEDKAALLKINLVSDRIIDAYARAVALSGTDTQYQEARVRWREQLTQFYKFRHNDSTDGLEAYIAGATARPLP